MTFQFDVSESTIDEVDDISLKLSEYAEGIREAIDELEDIDEESDDAEEEKESLYKQIQDDLEELHKFINEKLTSK